MPSSSRKTIELPESLWRDLYRAAAEEGLGVSSLAGQWLLARLRQERPAWEVDDPYRYENGPRARRDDRPSVGVLREEGGTGRGGAGRGANPWEASPERLADAMPPIRDTEDLACTLAGLEQAAAVEESHKSLIANERGAGPQCGAAPGAVYPQDHHYALKDGEWRCIHCGAR